MISCPAMSRFRARSGTKLYAFAVAADSQNCASAEVDRPVALVPERDAGRGKSVVPVAGAGRIGTLAAVVRSEQKCRGVEQAPLLEQVEESAESPISIG